MDGRTQDLQEKWKKVDAGKCLLGQCSCTIDFIVTTSENGYSKSFKGINELQPYEEVVMERRGCIGLVQKRMGTRLRDLKKRKKLQIIFFFFTTVGLGKLSYG